MSAIKLVVSNDARKPQRNKFRKGAEVQLRSGGPNMTVEIPGPERTQTIWFDDVGNEICTGTFLNYTLSKYVPKPEDK